MAWCHVKVSLPARSTTTHRSLITILVRRIEIWKTDGGVLNTSQLYFYLSAFLRKFTLADRSIYLSPALAYLPPPLVVACEQAKAKLIGSIGFVRPKLLYEAL